MLIYCKIAHVIYIDTTTWFACVIFLTRRAIIDFQTKSIHKRNCYYLISLIALKKEIASELTTTLNVELAVHVHQCTPHNYGILLI